MPNKNYIRGRAAEYDIVNMLKSGQGSEVWAQRMAGSHSPYDVVGVYPKIKEIHFVQSKTKLVNKKTLFTKITEMDESDGWKVLFYKYTTFIKRRNEIKKN
jgi:hypothetical protein